MKEVAIIVVTYNRKQMLKECLDRLLCQTYKNFDIYVVDNASTDGTEAYIADYIALECVSYRNTGKNLGGAGGFHFGIKQVANGGYGYIWLMDDDTFVDAEALEQLMKVDVILNGQYGFLASSVLWKDNSACVMNRQKLSVPWYSALRYLGNGILPIYMSTFVSFFVKIEVVRKVGLPIKEFFIWGDDVEYSQRIAKQYPCYLAGKSIVHHMTINNEGSNIAKDSEDRIRRYEFAYRNEVYIAKQNGIKGIVYQLAKIVLHCGRVIVSGKNGKMKKIVIILKNSVKGIFFNPKVEYIEEVK